MISRRNQRSAESGSSMLVVVLLMLVLGMAATMSFERHRVVENETRLELARLKALQAAEGALEIARFHRERTEAIPQSVRVGDCECSLTILDSEGQSDRRFLRIVAVRPAAPRVSEVLETPWE